MSLYWIKLWLWLYGNWYFWKWLLDFWMTNKNDHRPLVYLQAVQKFFYITGRRLVWEVLLMLVAMGSDYMLFHTVLPWTSKFTIIAYKRFLLHMHTHYMSSHFVFSVKAGFTVGAIERTQIFMHALKMSGEFILLSKNFATTWTLVKSTEIQWTLRTVFWRIIILEAHFASLDWAWQFFLSRQFGFESPKLRCLV